MTKSPRAVRQVLLSSLGLLSLAVSAPAASQKCIVADFEDFGTWRMRESGGLKPGAWWPAEVGLSGSDAAKDRDGLTGELKFAFGPTGTGPYFATFERVKMSQTSGFLDGIEWEANANNQPVALNFQIRDSANQTFRTTSVPLTGEGWQHYRLALNPETMPGFEKCKFPARLSRVTVEAKQACQGTVFLDNLALTGRFAKKDRLTVLPVYDKISHLPGEDIRLEYELRNASPEPVHGTLEITVKDFQGHHMLKKESPVSLEGLGTSKVLFPIEAFPLGAYEVALTAKSGDLELNEQDHFVVMVPNAGRPNKYPMWFGIADPTAWQGDLENRRHWEWMHLLGVDINRMQIFADRFEPAEGQFNEPGWRKMIQGHADAGVEIMVLYADTPKWVHSNWKWRTAPDLGDKFETHARHMGAFLKQFPNVTYLEFWNEPDLDFFEGTFGQYVTIFTQFAKGIRETNPDLQITSGGVTVQHPHEKPGFSKDMFQQTGHLYDVAAYHAHGPLDNNEERHTQVEKWLKEAGLEDKPLFNTETGERSLYTPEGRKRQAITLVKKLIFSKAQPRFHGFFWFTLQDYWDMDPESDDSFGLVTSDNRAKSSFATYNTLIRQLANTTPVAAPPATDDMTLFAFRRDDGRYVYAGWPVETKRSATLWIQTAQNLEVSDIFGAIRKCEPLGNILPVSIGELPLYISGDTPEKTIQICPPDKQFLTMDSEVRFIDANKPVPIPMRFRNPCEESLSGEFVLADGEGKEIAKQVFHVEAFKEIAWKPEIVPGKLERTRSLAMNLVLGGARPRTYSFPVNLIETYSLAKVPALGPNPGTWPDLQRVGALILNRPEQVIELAYDPNTPAWKGPQDLSASARLVHDGRGIRFQITVTDNVAGRVQPKDQLWRGDDVQVAFGRPDANKFTILDLGKSSEGAAVWCSEHENPAKIGQWDVPVSITTMGTVTTYDVYLPFDQLGITPAEKNLRLSFLVNDNDGVDRVRWIEWTQGIARDRSIESLGHGELE